MEKFKTWMEAKKEDNTYTLKALTDFAHALKGIFDKYSLQTREKAWNKLTSHEGDEEVRKLIRTPSRNLSGFRKL